jgi:hypothetical protein
MPAHKGCIFNGIMLSCFSVKDKKTMYIIIYLNMEGICIAKMGLEISTYIVK